MESRPERPMQLGDAIIGVIAGAFADHEEIEVILHVAADAGQIMQRLDADRPQMIRRSDTGLKQQLG